ncbi:hypothetical protein ACRHQN_27645 [Burkholderia pseudomallei]|uniref:hypothetical protein n=1 Tax=Burkholderia pseudomallei TaxID=28450 RepID=UPI00406481CF
MFADAPIPHVTKNDLYAELVQLGVAKGYVVIPEFRVRLADGHRDKNIDLVWATRKPNVGVKQDRKSPQYWTLHAAFEIESCDVRNILGKEFDRHIRDLPTVENVDPATPIFHSIVLYTTAYDRKWKPQRDVDADIRLRKSWAKGSTVVVIDGRDLSEVRSFRQAASGATRPGYAPQ